MGAPFDLTTTEAVKTWQGIASSDSDTQIAALISSSSRAILAFLGRPSVLPRAWADRYDGRPGLRRVMLRNWPVISVQSVIAGVTPMVATSPGAPSTGYALEADPWGGIPPGGPQSLVLYGQAGGNVGAQGLAVNYTAGYQAEDLFVVPSDGGTYTPAPAYGVWASDQGVVNVASGATLTRLAANTLVSAGQYSIDADGAYLFASADAGAAVAITYGYVPADLAQACVETAAHRLSAGGRVGVKSKSLGGQETVSYDMSGLPDAVKMMLQPYRRVAPL